VSEHPRESSQYDATDGSCSPASSRGPSRGAGKFLLLIAAGLVIIWFLVNGRTSAPADASMVAWVHDYDQALATAREKNQPVLLAFKASWCGPCRIMDMEVFSKDAAAKALSDWVPVSIDVDKQRELARRYRISGVPTFIALSPDGKELAQAVGGMSLQEFAQFLASAEQQLSSPTAHQ